MRSRPWAFLLALLVLPPARAADQSPRDVAALQESFQAAIRQAEPSIACILVSRSDIYRRWFHQGPPDDRPGHLGAFVPTARPAIPAQDAQERNDYLKLLEKRQSPAERFQRGRFIELRLGILFDLSDPENVPESYGSGVVIGKQGLVLTNYHVVRGATKVFV